MSLLTDRRESVCRCCPSRNYVAALGRGACKLLRDDSGRVSTARLDKAIESGVCPDGHFLGLVTEGNV